MIGVVTSMELHGDWATVVVECRLTIDGTGIAVLEQQLLCPYDQVPPLGAKVDVSVSLLVQQ